MNKTREGRRLASKKYDSGGPRTWLRNLILEGFAATVGKHGYGFVSFNLLELVRKAYPLTEPLDEKTVVHVGSDWIVSALYWRIHGAAKVIGYESDPRRKRWARMLKRETWFEPRGKWGGITQRQTCLRWTSTVAKESST